MRNYYVYILASGRNGTIYIGVTSDLRKRLFEHRNKLIQGFTSKYEVNTLVHYEMTEDVLSAMQREKQLKKWNRAWKIRLIEEVNHDWKDLSKEWFENTGFPPVSRRERDKRE